MQSNLSPSAQGGNTAYFAACISCLSWAGGGVSDGLFDGGKALRQLGHSAA